jgi:hypothetical protein
MKAWHDDYSTEMSRAEFVIRPNGKFVWTYRFFEAILCGPFQLWKLDPPPMRDSDIT